MKLSNLNKSIKYEDLIKYFKNYNFDFSNPEELKQKYPIKDILTYGVVGKSPVSYDIVYQFINDYQYYIDVDNLGKFIYNNSHFKFYFFIDFLKNCYQFINKDVYAITFLLHNYTTYQNDNSEETKISNLIELIKYILLDNYFNINIFNFDMYKLLDNNYINRFESTLNIFNTIIDVIKNNNNNIKLIKILNNQNLLIPILKNCQYHIIQDFYLYILNFPLNSEELKLYLSIINNILTMQKTVYLNIFKDDEFKNLNIIFNKISKKIDIEN